MYDQYMTQRVNATAYYHGPVFAHPKDADHEHHQQHHDNNPGPGQLGLLSSSPPMFIRYSPQSKYVSMVGLCISSPLYNGRQKKQPP